MHLIRLQRRLLGHSLVESVQQVLVLDRIAGSQDLGGAGPHQISYRVEALRRGLNQGIPGFLGRAESLWPNRLRREHSKSGEETKTSHSPFHATLSPYYRRRPPPPPREPRLPPPLK